MTAYQHGGACRACGNIQLYKYSLLLEVRKLIRQSHHIQPCLLRKYPEAAEEFMTVI